MMPTWKQFLNEGILSKYRNEREGRKLTYNDFKGTFELILCKLIEERIPFWFDCQGVGGDFSNVTKIGYLMNESINDQSFGGYILNVEDPTDEDAVKNLVVNQILPNIIVEKPGRLFIGRTNYSDLTKAADLDTISVVVRAFKTFYKQKEYSAREISGNKYETKVKIDFLCDSNTVNNIIDYVF
jgi:hypothetical protein